MANQTNKITKKNKKELTASQKQRKYRVLQYVCNGGEVASILTPFIILGIVNYEEWFVSEEGWKIGLGGSLAFALLGIALMLFTKKKEDSSITNGWISMIIGWFAITFIFYLLGSIIDQISTIMFFGGFGLLGAFGLDMLSKNQKDKADAYKSALQEVKKDNIKEQAKKEVDKEQGERQATE